MSRDLDVHSPPKKGHELSIDIVVNVPPGKSILTIDQYAALLLPFGIQDDHCRVNHYGCVTTEEADSLCVVQTDDSHFSLLPGPEFSPHLYRGQPAFYEECLPSLFRKPIIQIKYLTDLLKKYEFYKLMAGHPMIGHLVDWCIDGKCFKVDMEGLAAHYEFATAMIDVSRSRDVAMFFALCEKNKMGIYVPIVDENREVVLYTINLQELIYTNNPAFHVIGFQPLPRPDAQKAYSLWINHGENLNEYLFITRKVFKVHRKESQKYFDMFEGGAKLFPNDPVDEMALEIRQSMEIDRDVLETCFERHRIPKAWDNLGEVINFLGCHGYSVKEKLLALSDANKRTIIQKWNSSPPLSAGRVKCRFVTESA